MDKQVCISQILLPFLWKQMQIVRMDLLKKSADPRCRKLYDAHVQRQSTWTKKFPPAVEHACAATVVEANPLASNQLQSSQFVANVKCLPAKGC